MKILAIKFKYLGDVAAMIPALYALRQKWPKAELNVLVAGEAVAILEHMPWIDKVWGLPRKRGKWSLKKAWPMIKELRGQKFDRSVDFIGNDRGAILSFLIGAKRRLGPIVPKGFLGRKYCYHERIEEADTTRHEVIRDWHILSKWRVPFPSEPYFKIFPKENLLNEAKEMLPRGAVIFHLSTSQLKKEWPLENWVELIKRCQKHHLEICVSSGPSKREQDLLVKLKKMHPKVKYLEKAESLERFMAMLSQAYCLVSPDTAPVHLAVGLGVPTVSMYGPTASSRWAPIGGKSFPVQARYCPCDAHLHKCVNENSCMGSITVDRVFEKVKEALS